MGLPKLSRPPHENSSAHHILQEIPELLKKTTNLEHSTSLGLPNVSRPSHGNSSGHILQDIPALLKKATNLQHSISMGLPKLNGAHHGNSSGHKTTNLQHSTIMGLPKVNGAYHGNSSGHKTNNLQHSTSMGLPKVSPQSIHHGNSSVNKHRSHQDDDPDICILQDIPALQKKTTNLQHSTRNDPLHYPELGSSRSKAIDESYIFRIAVKDLSQPNSEASPPDGVLVVPLMRHQRIALSWMIQKETANRYCLGGILADDQGLGKTVSTIALILSERSPSFKARPNNVKIEPETVVNLDADDDEAIVLEGIKQESGNCHVKSEGPSRGGSLSFNVKGKQETVVNLDGDDDGATALEGIKEEFECCDVKFNGCLRGMSLPLGQAKGRPAAGTLVVCPKSVLLQWAAELQNKVTKEANLSVLVYHGSNRTKDPFELAKYDVVLTTYSIVSMEVPKKHSVEEDDDRKCNSDGISFPVSTFKSSKKRKHKPTSEKKAAKHQKRGDELMREFISGPLSKVGWFRVILDEAQIIKNHRTRVANACWGLRAKRRWCLSGTPIQNTIDDLYSYFRFLKYYPLSTYQAFQTAILNPVNCDPAKGYLKLQAILKTILLRRTKGTLLDGKPIITLPPKVVELKKVDFTDEERDFYTTLENGSRAKFREYVAAGTVKVNYFNILLMLLRLRQACNHPLLVKGSGSSALWRYSAETAKKLPSEKITSLLSVLEASLVPCGICNEPPEDAVVTICSHVFCYQCIYDYLTGDDSRCPTNNCKVQLSMSNVFSKATLNNESSLSEESADNSSPSEVEFVEPYFDGRLYKSSKIKAALEVLQSLTKPSSDDPNKPGEKAIVFSQWTSMLNLFEACLKSSSIQYRRLDGTMSLADRDEAVKDFNTMPEVTIMIISLRAASLGLNLVAASRVILLDPWWNPTTEDQAIDRAHRIGQTRSVTVLRLTVKDTVEDRILALQQKKRKMVASAFGEDETGIPQQNHLTVDDLKYLFMA